METRRGRLLGPEGGRGAGLEIGALNAPLLTKDRWDVRYVDYATTEVVRANQFDPAIDPAKIVEVDIVWGERPLREAVGRPVDFVVASHVVEHVPDLVGWLRELRDALLPDGILGLAVPDRRFTFDALRRESTLAEAIEAHLLGYRQPSLRQVFDAAALGVAVDGGEVWRGAFRPEARHEEVLGRLPNALALVRRLHAKPRYQDAHCWVFTPASFLDLVEGLATLGLFPFEIEAFHPTEAGGGEFHVRLRATDAAEAPLASIRAARAGLDAAPRPPDPLETEIRRLEGEALRLERETLRLESELDRLRSEVEALRAEVPRLAGEVQALRRSTSWRLTAPLRTLVGWTRRGPAA